MVMIKILNDRFSNQSNRQLIKKKNCDQHYNFYSRKKRAGSAKVDKIDGAATTDGLFK